MAREIPEAVRAAAGLVATVLDEARKLPGELPHLPVRLLGLAMQTSLVLQQQYSGLVARGDEVFTGLWGDSEPGMATFDEDLPETPVATPPTANRTSAFDRAAEPASGPVEDAVTGTLVDDVADVTGDPADLTVELSDEIADLSETSELADIAGLADLVEAAAADVAEDAGQAAEDDAPLADVLAFETLAGEGDDITDDQAAALPADPPADAVTTAVDELAEEVDAELAAELPESVPDEVADDLAADTVATVADAEVAADTAATDDTATEPAGDTTEEDGAPDSSPDEATVRDLGLVGTADATDPDLEIPDLDLPELPGEPAEPAAAEDAAPADKTAAADEVAPVEDATPAEDAAPVQEATPAEEAVAEDTAPVEDVTPADDAAPAEDAATAVDAAPAAPVPGYDGFSIPSLRGHLRGYTAEAVADLLDYERSTQARPPYVTLLQNRLEKLSADRG